MSGDPNVTYTTESGATPPAEDREIRWIICPTCFYEREAGIGCGLPCV